MTHFGNNNKKRGGSYYQTNNNRRNYGKYSDYSPDFPEYAEKNRQQHPRPHTSKPKPWDQQSACTSGHQSDDYRTHNQNNDLDSYKLNGGKRSDNYGRGKNGQNDRNGKGKRPYRKERHKKQSTTTASNHCEASDELDIPGFFYDKEKKRYFKVAPNHSGNNYTKDAIARKEAETQRQKDVEDIFQKKDKSVTKKVYHTNNFTGLVQDRAINSLNCQLLQSRVCRTTVCNLKPVGSQHLFDPQCLGMYDNLEHMSMMHVGKNHNELLGLWSLKETWVQRIQMVNLTEKMRTSEKKPLSLTANVHQKVIIQSLNKVTDLCWAPMTNDRKHILYTTICHTGYLYSLAMIRSLDADEDSGSGTFLDYNIGKKATWTCAWNVHKQQFSVGSEKCGLILNVERRTLWEYNTNNSDPLAQVFSHETGSYLHMGTRKGHVLTYDMRSRSTFPVSTLHHKSSVCALNLLQNDIHLIAADFSGKVCLWDLRKRDVAVEYMGNVNQYSRLPVHMDEMEKIVYTVGEDGYTRFWCLQQGTLLHTIPPPCAVSRETIPSVQLSMRWGNRQGNAGLIMGLENKLHFYGSLPLS